MIKIEQAQEVAKRLRSLMGSWPLPQEAANTIDALIAELAALKAVAMSDDGAGGEGMMLYIRNRELNAELAALKGQEPVAWMNSKKDMTYLHGPYHQSDLPLFLEAGAQPYDQQAMEPCDACGWKAIIPGEPCLMCERNDALAAGAQSIPSGYQLVPVEPTPAMVDATGATESDMREMVVADYKAMLAAGAQLATKQEPVAWALPEITQQHNGQIVKHTAFHGYSVPLYLAAGAQPYDQQAMELCEACGWKAIIPGEQCLVCERNDALAAGAQIIPAGYQLVRIEPTDQMLEMGSIATDYDYSQEWIKRVWQQMLMAAARDQGPPTVRGPRTVESEHHFAGAGKPLTDEQIHVAIAGAGVGASGAMYADILIVVARAIEAKIKEQP